ncbi:MAG: glycosyltransferase [candidate division WOR-3 bacterium]|nr:MAG: glycosyltransferase [candidate division WOR-3 bacterium]
MEQTPYVSVVIIGKDEEKNLANCIRSVRDIEYPAERVEIIYVDNGSHDRSVAIARQQNINTVEERGQYPSPGLARNRGIREAKYDIIHFIDGDMTMDSGYLGKAVRFLDVDKIGCVIGDVQELGSESSFLSRVLNYPWASRKTGFVEAPGGGGTFRKSVLEAVEGYNPYVLKGQETEIGYRIREEGYRIYKIDHLMAMHDYGINRLDDLVKRSYRMGSSYGMIMTMPQVGSYADLTRRARSLFVQGMLLTVVIAMLIITGRLFLLLAVPLVICLYVLLRHWREIVSARDARAYAYYLLMQFNKPVVLCGFVACLLRRCTSFFSRFLLGRAAGGER